MHGSAESSDAELLQLRETGSQMLTAWCGEMNTAALSGSTSWALNSNPILGEAVVASGKRSQIWIPIYAKIREREKTSQAARGAIATSDGSMITMIGKEELKRICS